MHGNSSLSIGRRETRHRIGLLAAMAMSLMIFIGAVMPSSASALTRQWNCGLISPNSWCQLTENHTWKYSSAWWNGTQIPMCAKIVNSANQDGGTRVCGTASAVYSNDWPASQAGPNLFAMAANGNSGTSKTITGFAETY